MPNFTTIPQQQLPQLIASAAGQYGVPPSIAIEQAMQESKLIQTAVSPAGAVGVMQLEPATAAQLGVNPYDTTQNVSGGMQYLSQLFAQFGDWGTALAAYDWGPGNVQDAINTYGANWLSAAPAETQNYVSTILGNSGQSYTATLTPDSVANGAQGVASSLAETVTTAAGSLNPSTVFLVSAFVVGAFLLGDLLFGD